MDGYRVDTRQRNLYWATFVLMSPVFIQSESSGNYSTGCTTRSGKQASQSYEPVPLSLRK
jgi:hypothetical protein